MSSPSDLQENVQEIADRCRRMETRLTRFLELQGFDTGVQRAVWVDDAVDIPTDAIALKECLSVIPSDHVGQVHVMLKGRHIATLLVP